MSSIDIEDCDAKMMGRVHAATREGSPQVSKRQSVAVLTYNGVDGACAAAMVLLKHPEADVFVTSAARVGRTMSELAWTPKPPGEIHVCGLGVYCDWGELSGPALKLRERGASITWYCGRGYVDDRRLRVPGHEHGVRLRASQCWRSSECESPPGPGTSRPPHCPRPQGAHEGAGLLDRSDRGVDRRVLQVPGRGDLRRDHPEAFQVRARRGGQKTGGHSHCHGAAEGENPSVCRGR